MSVPLNKLPYCGTSFASKGNLKQHVEAIHEKRRDFACTVCDAKFYFKHKMEDHVKAKHLGKDGFRNRLNTSLNFNHKGWDPSRSTCMMGGCVDIEPSKTLHLSWSWFSAAQIEGPCWALSWINSWMA